MILLTALFYSGLTWGSLVCPSSDIVMAKDAIHKVVSSRCRDKELVRSAKQKVEGLANEQSCRTSEAVKVGLEAAVASTKEILFNVYLSEESFSCQDATAIVLNALQALSMEIDRPLPAAKAPLEPTQ